MATLTFNPIPPPDGNMRVAVKPRVLEQSFGDGYTQRAKDGINNDLREYPLKWSNLYKSEADAIIAFLTEREGYKKFRWTPSGETAQKTFTCKEWDYAWKNGKKCDITAKLVQAAAV